MFNSAVTSHYRKSKSKSVFLLSVTEKYGIYLHIGLNSTCYLFLQAKIKHKKQLYKIYTVPHTKSHTEAMTHISVYQYSLSNGE